MTYRSFESVLSSVERYLQYNPQTGTFIWKVKRDWKTPAGSIAGYVMNTGYRCITLFETRILAHRLAWALHHQEDPGDLQVDHINRNRSDNRICNLRLVDASTNQRNRGLNSNNKSGYAGVCFHKATGKWRATVCYGYKSKHLGLFSTPEEASAAYLIATQ